MKKIFVFSLIFLIAGCATLPEDAFLVTEARLEKRSLETRRYDGISELDLLAACTQVFQDIGLGLENSATELGVITANKARDAGSGVEVRTGILFGIGSSLGMGISLGGAADKEQTIRASLVVHPVRDSKGKSMQKSHLVRVTFQRSVIRGDNSVRYETMKDPKLYEDFFDRLSKSVFLEGQKI